MVHTVFHIFFLPSIGLCKTYDTSKIVTSLYTIYVAFLCGFIEYMFLMVNKMSLCLTCTLASLKSKFFANSSRVNTSGYCVFSNDRSNWCSWNVVNVVLDLLIKWKRKRARRKSQAKYGQPPKKRTEKKGKKRGKNPIYSTVLENNNLHSTQDESVRASHWQEHKIDNYRLILRGRSFGSWSP